MTRTTSLFSGAGADPSAPAETDIPTRMLVFGMAHEDGTLLAAEVYPVGEACGQSADQIRSCLRRLVADGLFTRDGEGREAVFHATAAGAEALRSSLRRTRLAYLQDAAGQAWDRRWRLVGFAIPEAKRSARDAFRDRLLALGGAALQPGLYVSPHRWEDDVVAEATALDVAEHLVIATTDDLCLGGERDPKVLAARLWPLDELAQRYGDFVERYQGIPAALEAMRRERRRLSDAEFLPGNLVIGLRFQECFDLDPVLPPDLLPRPWPGRQARELLARSRRLGVLLREDHDRPQLFAPFDDLLSSMVS